MHSILPFLAVLSVVSGAAMKTRADMGYWDYKASVSFPASAYTTYTVDATYHNSELEEPVEIHCTYTYDPKDQTETAECSEPSFSYDFGGVSMSHTTTNNSLKQTVPLNGEQVTVFGTSELKWDFSGGSGRSGHTEGKIDVTSAIA
ncbi:hypothetical protein BU24DRAFT_121501 [Aaosphaeria arxii CBS 175.79]|uniref:AA1-like domain-containing protein n=1 Tax=Aaosphaeria arxii CBS 175.79 TaxID=1450172 RepID=A0A6A5Y1T0_9PLEO|nr:uncharacterized protein BU24DRAFT_121501 [Aaosphaeria arxii CBS 175.79]KAF2019525.1 hypothetical protein BU24DRAFT_121501 [Aaosphaeria arxii CBS 175.79]